MSEHTLLLVFLGILALGVLSKVMYLGAWRYPREVPAWSDAGDVLEGAALITLTVWVLQ